MSYESGLYIWDMPSIPAVLGWTLTGGRALRRFNQDTKEIIDDTGHPHVLIKRTARKNVIEIRVQFPQGELDTLGSVASATPLRDYLMTTFLNKTTQLIFDRDMDYAYAGVISKLDEEISGNQVVLGNPKRLVGFTMTCTWDGYWTVWDNSSSTTEYPRS